MDAVARGVLSLAFRLATRLPIVLCAKSMPSDVHLDLVHTSLVTSRRNRNLLENRPRLKQQGLLDAVDRLKED